MKKLIVPGLVLSLLLALTSTTFAAKQIGVNVLLNTEATDEILTELGSFGKVKNQIFELNAVMVNTTYKGLAEIQALPYVLAANPDAKREGVPIDAVPIDTFDGGLSTWNLDVINVTTGPSEDPEDPLYEPRAVAYTGEGVYVAVLDTGLVDTWRAYFPDERIATEYAIAYGGGGGEVGNVSTQPNKWEHDTDSHGTHVTSTIIGYNLRGAPVNGVAPDVKIIPVKVLNQNGSGWSSMVAAGITYIGKLKAENGPLENYPIVINMSLGGPELDAVEKAAIDYAMDQGVIVVASAGNEGEAGMGYPGAYKPVISVAASGHKDEWLNNDRSWWLTMDDPEPNDPALYYITDFSSRELAGQYLDVAAPGSWIVGAYKTNNGNSLSYYFLGGTSMASPHVAGVVALILEKDPELLASDAEAILKSTAIPLDAGCLDVGTPYGYSEEICWGEDATGFGIVDAAAALDAP